MKKNIFSDLSFKVYLNKPLLNIVKSVHLEIPRGQNYVCVWGMNAFFLIRVLWIHLRQIVRWYSYPDTHQTITGLWEEPDRKRISAGRKTIEISELFLLNSGHFWPSWIFPRPSYFLFIFCWGVGKHVTWRLRSGGRGAPLLLGRGGSRTDLRLRTRVSSSSWHAADDARVGHAPWTGMQKQRSLGHPRRKLPRLPGHDRTAYPHPTASDQPGSGKSQSRFLPHVFLRAASYIC